MKTLFTLTAALALLSASAQSTNLYDYSVKSITGDTIHMAQYAGKKLMIVNVASFCAYTPQYEQLQELYNQYQQNNFEIIGFPTDDFFQQGGKDSDIIATCNSYNVTFPITEKVRVNSSPTEPVFNWLKQQSLNGVSNASVTWNFNKFLISENGQWVQHYTQSTLPDDPAIINWILSSTGVDEVKAPDLITLQFSNPAGNELRLLIPQNYSRLTVRLYSTDGKLVSTLLDGVAQQGQQLVYNSAVLAAGLYILNVQSEGAQQTRKVVAGH
ncbi:MAG: T9SS type A sorting domain-containing protein [Chitinophagales bacterium]|nr:T9SS type A sorting domain-containing protein [Chitinophagales bacterium]